MTPTSDPTRHPALELPLDRIRWAQNLMPRPTEGEVANLRPRRRRLLAGLGVAAAVTACASTAEAAQRPTLDPTLACDIYTVKPGDWMSRIALKQGLTPQELIARNPHIPDPNRIWPGDEIVLRCLPRTPTTAPTTSAPAAPPTTAPAVLEVNAMQAAPKPPPVVDWPGAMPFIPGEQIVDGVVSQGLILRLLYDQGARGNQLIGLASVTECESNRNIGAINHEDAKPEYGWGPSVSPWQVRTRLEERGTGGPRDIERLQDPAEAARTAHELYEDRLRRGHDPLRDWTCHLNGGDRNFVAPYTELAQKMGLL